MNPPPMLMLAREIEALAGCIQTELMLANTSRGFVEAYSARLLKAAARLYAATIPPAATTSQGERNAA